MPNAYDILKDTMAFSKEKVNLLNEKIANVDDRLFFLWNYKPKEVRPSDSSREIFRVAMINMGILLNDSGGRQTLNYIINKFDNKNDTDFFRNFIYFANNMRNYMCHNLYDTYFNRNTQNSLEEFMVQKFNFSAYECDIEKFKDDSWFKLTQCVAENLNELEKKVLMFLEMQTQSKEKTFVDDYLKQLLEWFKKKDFYLDVYAAEKAWENSMNGRNYKLSREKMREDLENESDKKKRWFETVEEMVLDVERCVKPLDPMICLKKAWYNI